MANQTDSSIVQLQAPTHLPTKLTQTNFVVWRRQLFSTLIGYDLLGYVDGTIQPPPKQLDNIPNPAYSKWYRQDQIIVSAILGSCIATIQTHISSVTTSKEAWDRLMILYANKSRTRIISLKQRLIENPADDKPVATYLQEMRGIADELALADCPVDEDDLVLHTLHRLGPDFKEICAAVRARDTPISFDELHDKLVDYEMQQKTSTKLPTPVIPTANYSQRSNRAMNRGGTQAPNNNFSRTRSHPESHSNHSHNHFRNHGAPSQQKSTGSTSTFNKNAVCNFCERNGHYTKDCRNLARFLRENGFTPTANFTTTQSSPWIFDSGASHHVATDTRNLQSFSDYGGPEEIILGDGSGSEHGGATSSRGKQQ